MSVWEKIQRAQSTLALFFATILIIPFQVLLFGFVLIGSYDMQTGMLDLSISLSNNIPYFAIYVVLTILYCIILSLVFHPKRIVSPINIQIGTASVLSSFLIYSQIANMRITSMVQALGILGSLALTIIFLTFFLITIGIFQFLVVKLVVALNFESVDRVSFLIDGKPEKILGVLGDEFVDVWEFSRRKDNPKAKKNPIWVLKCRDPYGNSVILTLGSYLGDNKKCVLATVSYHKSLYSISRSKTSSGMRASIINDIKERLAQSNLKSSLTQMEGVDDPISFKAYSHALASTLPKTEITKEFFRNIPRYYLYGIIVTLIALVSMSVAFIAGLLDNSTYVGGVIVLIVALLAELGVSLREELSRQEIEELD